MHITYLFDPLCGWCYGATGALEQISRLGGVTIQLSPTGLFAGEGARPMDQSFAAYAWQNDQRIARLTGQAFSETYRQQVLGAVGSTFDSAPATLAIVAVGLQAPAQEMAALKALQQARYVDGRDNGNMDVVIDILAAAGFSDAAGRLRAPDQQLLAAYRTRIKAARADMARFSANGVPALIIGKDDKRRLLPSGTLFGDPQILAAQLEAA
ncbi:DsbA family protein [Devosia sp. ZW T5_3]|uniref:DsbA family protein n=1 Tax=Devosia sp. ZW T5_3 TaxID=3378085 RepID=UPI003853CD06